MGRCYPHLSVEERGKIDKWREAKMPAPETADRLGRAPSTIYRELKQNTYEDKELPELNGYYCVTAQAKYEKRRAIYRKMIAHPDLKATIEDRLKAGWSPEQIAGRMRVRRPRRARKRQKPKFDRNVNILFRSDYVAHRRKFGHWGERDRGPRGAT